MIKAVSSVGTKNQVTFNGNLPGLTGKKVKAGNEMAKSTTEATKTIRQSLKNFIDKSLDFVIKVLDFFGG